MIQCYRAQECCALTEKEKNISKSSLPLLQCTNYLANTSVDMKGELILSWSNGSC